MRRHVFDQIAFLELHRRQIHRDFQGARPRRCIDAGLLQHPGADRADHAGLFSDGNEISRADASTHGMCPAQQGFKSGDALDLNKWLVEDLKLLLGQRQTQIQFERPPHLHRGIHLRLKEPECSAAVVFCPIERKVGTFQKCIGGLKAVKRQGDADAHANHDHLFVDFKRLIHDIYQSPGQCRRIRWLICFFLHDDELIAAKSNHEIRLSRAFPQPAA